MAETGGLVTSFLSAFQGLTEMERERKRDRQAAAQAAVRNALEKHSQELEAQRIKQTGEYQQEQIRVRQEEAETRRLREEQQQKHEDESIQRLTAKNTRDAFMKAFHDLYFSGNVTGKQAMQGAQLMSGYQPTAQDTTEVGEFGSAVGGVGWMDKPNSRAEADLRLKASKAAYTEAEIERHKKLDDIDMKLKESTLTMRADRHTKEIFLNQIAPEQWRFKKMIEEGKLNVSRVNAETNKLRVQAQIRGQDAMLARTEAQSQAKILDQYVGIVGAQYKTAKKLHEDALQAAHFATEEINQLRAKKDLTPAEQDMLIKAQALHKAYNEKDKSGKSRLDYLAEDRTNALNELNSATSAAKSTRSIFQTPVNAKGGLQVMPVNPSNIRPSPPPNAKALRASAAAKTVRRQFQDARGNLHWFVLKGGKWERE